MSIVFLTHRCLRHVLCRVFLLARGIFCGWPTKEVFDEICGQYSFFLETWLGRGGSDADQFAQVRQLVVTMLVIVDPRNPHIMADVDFEGIQPAAAAFKALVPLHATLVDTPQATIDFATAAVAAICAIVDREPKAWAWVPANGCQTKADMFTKQEVMSLCVTHVE